MRYFNQILFVCIMASMGSVLSQSITLNTCNALIDGNDYVFEQTSLVNERNVFETVTDPMTGSRDCSGIGFCKIRIAWNDTQSRWEIFADDGNDGFNNVYLLYYNTEASLPNPPDLTLGTWVEETATTQSLCGNIIVLSGAVQSSVLSTDDANLVSQFKVFPNPVKDILYFRSNILNSDYSVSFFDVLGKRVLKSENQNSIDVSKLKQGIYFLKLETEKATLTKKIIIK